LLTLERANDARVDFADLPIRRYPHHPFADRMWDLRQNLTASDAAYVALSEALEAPLVTCDARLATSPGHQAQVEVFAP
jgi:predicted nucleic acid-binding protein